jgi:hypothetical protein
MSVVDTYNQVLSIDVGVFINDYISFIDNNYQQIVDYYTNGQDIDNSVINNLKNLYDNSKIIIDEISNGKDYLGQYYDSWELLELIEEINIKIDTIRNSQKWFRSSKSLFYSNEFKQDYVLKQGQTLERLADELGYSQPNNDWQDIALYNDLREEDYSPEGGKILKITFRNNSEIVINSIIDSPVGDRVYGIDLDKKIQFKDNDLKILSPKETIIQSFGILINLTKGSVPEFPSDGIDKSILGSNINSVQYPVLFRQISSLFSKDDTFKDFSISKIDRVNDSIYIEVQARTRLNDVLYQELKVGS